MGAGEGEKGVVGRVGMEGDGSGWGVWEASRGEEALAKGLGAMGEVEGVWVGCECWK